MAKGAERERQASMRLHSVRVDLARPLIALDGRIVLAQVPLRFCEVEPSGLHASVSLDRVLEWADRLEILFVLEMVESEGEVDPRDLRL